jgi:hypothetical protein
MIRRLKPSAAMAGIGEDRGSPCHPCLAHQRREVMVARGAVSASFDPESIQGRAMRQNAQGARAKASCAAVMQTGRVEDDMVVAPRLPPMDVQMMRARACAARPRREINSACRSCSR